jgi:ankyrin repeat protein
LKQLVGGGQYDIGTRDMFGRTIVFFAAAHNHLHTLMWILEEDEMNATHLLNEYDIDGNTVLGYIAQREVPIAITEYLVERGALFFPGLGINANILNACPLDHLRRLIVFDEIIDSTIMKQQALIQACNMLLADDEMLEDDLARERIEILLVEMRRDELNFISNDQTPLITAIERRNIVVAKLLIEHGARTDFADGRNRLPADVLPPEISIEGIFHSPPAAVLYELVEAIKDGNTLKFGELIEEVHPYTMIQAEGRVTTMINYLCMQESEESLMMLDILVSYHPTTVSGLNSSNMMSSTPLDVAVGTGNFKMADRLIKAGANPKYVTGTMLVTPFERAMSEEVWDVAKALVQSSSMTLYDRADVLSSHLLKMTRRRANREAIVSVFDVAYQTDPSIVTFAVQEKSGCVFTISDLFRGLMDARLNKYRNIESEIRTTPYDLTILTLAIEDNDTVTFNMIMKKSHEGLVIPHINSDFDDLMLKAAAARHPMRAAALSDNPYYLKRLVEDSIGSMFTGTEHILEIASAQGKHVNVRFIMDVMGSSISGAVLRRSVERSSSNSVRTYLYKEIRNRLNKVRDAETLVDFQNTIDPALMFIEIREMETMAEIIVSKVNFAVLRYVSSLELSDTRDSTLKKLMKKTDNPSLRNEIALAFSRSFPVDLKWTERIGSYTEDEYLPLRMSIRRTNFTKVKDNEGRPPLMVAIDRNDEVAFNALIDEGASIKDSVRSKDGKTILMHFVLSDLPTSLIPRIISRDDRSSLELTDKEGKTALDYDAGRGKLRFYQDVSTEVLNEDDF